VPSVLAHHQALIDQSAISPEVADERGYFSVSEPKELNGLFGGVQRRAPVLMTTGDHTPVRCCALCGRSMLHKRPYAVYCSGACRAAASRTRAPEPAERLRVGLGPTPRPGSGQTRTEGAQTDGERP
jgi:hypothetical protein